MEAVLGRLTKFHFLHPKTLAIGQYREESVLVAVQLDLLEYPAVEGASATTEVVVLQPRYPRQQAVEYGASQPLEWAARAGPAPTDREIARIERGDQLFDVRRLNLVVGGQGHDDLPRGMLESCHERSGFAEGACQADHGEAVTRLEQRAQSGGEIAVRTIEDENQLVRLAQRVETGLVLRVQRRGVGVARADRYDHGEFDVQRALKHASIPRIHPAAVRLARPFR